MTEDARKLTVGDRLIETRPDGAEVEHHVIRVRTKRATLKADLGYARQTAVVWIDLLLNSPDWRRA